jgi:hypothetical protein
MSGENGETRQWHQRKLVSLRPGDKAWWISGNWGKPELVEITGECDEGDGYTAHSKRFAEQYPDKGDPSDPDFCEPGSIHTCNGFICKTRQEARAESLKIARNLREQWAAKRKEAEHVVQYLDWVIAMKGKHP